MSRGYVINGETMVYVAGGEHNQTLLDARVYGDFCELGLTHGQVEILPRFFEQPIPAEDFGPFVAPDHRAMMADAVVRMTLSHYDPGVLRECWHEAMASDPNGYWGSPAPAGTPLGKGIPLAYSGNVLMGLYLPCMNYAVGIPWYFPAVKLTAPPLHYPIGTERTLAVLEWKAIPYQIPLFQGYSMMQNLATGMSGYPYEVVSSGIQVWYNLYL